MITHFTLSKDFNLSIFKKKKTFFVYIYHKNFFFLIKISSDDKLELKNQKYFLIKTNFLKKKNFSNSFFCKFTNQFWLYQFSKIKFSGKGYKIKKNQQNNLKFLFNKSHLTNIWYNNIIIKKYRKYKIYIKYTYDNYVIIPIILNIRYINIFTKKGLRNSRQMILKKKGKK